MENGRYSWIELEQGFRRLRVDLQAHYLALETIDGEDRWYMRGGERNLACMQFEVLTWLAGRRLRLVFKGKDAFEREYLAIPIPELRWYHALRQLSPAFNALSPKGESENFSGRVDRIAEAAADLCLKFQGTHPLAAKLTLIEWLRINWLRVIMAAMVTAFASYVAAWGYGFV